MSKIKCFLAKDKGQACYKLHVNSFKPDIIIHLLNAKLKLAIHDKRFHKVLS